MVEKYARWGVRLPTQLSDLKNWDFCVSRHEPLKEIVKELEANPELPGVMIGNKSHIIAMVSRHDCFEKLSRPYGLDLFVQKPVGDVLSHFATPYDVFQADTLIQDAVSRALSRPADLLYEPIIVQFDDKSFRMIDFHNLLLAQTRLLEESNEKVLQQFNVARSLSSTLDLDFFSDYILEFTEEIVPHTRVIFILKKKGSYLVQSISNFPENVFPEDIGSCLDDFFPQIDLVERNNPLLFPDQVLMEQVNHLLDENILWQFFPVVHADVIIAGILFGRPDPAGIGNAVFEHSELVTLSSYCPTLATALRNSQLYEEVQRSSMTDPLTNVLNRRGIIKEYLPSEGLFFSVLMLDIDHFKQINDSYGHLIGDEILKQLIRIINRIIRPGDRIGRYGGDEFVILLKHTDLERAVRIAERIRLTVREYQFRFEGQTVSISISIGVAQSTGNETVDSVIQQADHLLYFSKENGRNQVSSALNLE